MMFLVIANIAYETILSFQKITSSISVIRSINFPFMRFGYLTKITLFQCDRIVTYISNEI